MKFDVVPTRSGSPRVESLESRTMLATYYVSFDGDDSASGDSRISAWQSIDRVNKHDFDPGDSILFQGGSSFRGSLQLDADDAGTASRPVTIGSYGDSRATIDSRRQGGIFIYNAGGIEIDNINVAGSGRQTNSETGISFYNDLDGDVRLKHVSINNVDVSSYGNWAIAIGSHNGFSGFSDVRITRANLHDSGGGLITYAQQGRTHRDVYVSDVRAHDNSGIAGNDMMGDGIVLGNVNRGVIERSVAYDNGLLNTDDNEGPVGIWTYQSKQIVIQYNEAWNNRTSKSDDGGGFDLDGGVIDSILQYNYSHDNDGAGFLLYQYPGAGKWANNIVRYNISQNDGRKNSYGGILIGGKLSDADIYHNTIYTTPSSSGSPAAVVMFGGTGIRFANNLFITDGGARLINKFGDAEARFYGNNYYSSGSPFRILDNGSTYSSLSGWREGTNQEILHGRATGRSVDPRLRDAGNAGTVNNPNRLASSLSEYRLGSDSPLIDNGVYLSSMLGITAGPWDFFGNETYQDNGYDIGANEFSGT